MFLISSIIEQMVARPILIAIRISAVLSGELRLNRVCAQANPKKKYFNRRIILYFLVVYIQLLLLITQVGMEKLNRCQSFVNQTRATYHIKKEVAIIAKFPHCNIFSK